MVKLVISQYVLVFLRTRKLVKVEQYRAEGGSKFFPRFSSPMDCENSPIVFLLSHSLNLGYQHNLSFFASIIQCMNCHYSGRCIYFRLSFNGTLMTVMQATSKSEILGQSFVRIKFSNYCSSKFGCENVVNWAPHCSQ